jgi:SAM-dependent methyltransferase
VNHRAADGGHPAEPCSAVPGPASDGIAEHRSAQAGLTAAEPCSAVPGQDWWRSAFADDYLERYAHRDDADADRLVAALVPLLADAPGPVADVGCGAGRHLVRLRAAGIPAVGLDYSADLLRAGRGPRCRADMRAPPFAGGLGAALFLFTAFGYFDDAGNLACLRAWARRLAPGGRLVLDLPDPAALVLPPDGQRRLADGSTVREARRWDGRRVEKAITLVRPDGTRLERFESVRLYGRDAWPLIGIAAGGAVRIADHPDAGRLLVVLHPLT